MNTEFDAIIIGSGAGGAATAFRLAEAGRKVLILEKGPELPSDGSTQDVRAVLREGRFNNREAWADRHGKPFVPSESYNLGGKTKWYGAALLRFGRDEFDADPAYQYRGWPLPYEELEPYYEEAEVLFGVRKFEIEPDTARMVAALKRSSRAWSPAPLPLGLSPCILDHPEEAIRFDGFASAHGLKSDAETQLLSRIRGKPNVTVLTGAPVQSLLGDDLAPHKIAGVVMEDGTAYRARAVILAAGALSSPRLLQQYLEKAGLAPTLPSAASVGRNYKSHLLTAVVAFSAARKRDLLRKTVVLTHEAFPHSSVQPLGATDGEIIAAELPAFTPGWAADLIGSRAFGFFLQTEDGSNPENRVAAALNGAARPCLDYDVNRIAPSRDEHRRFVRAFKHSLLKAGMIPAVKPVPLSATAHACGTLIAGEDPANSVVDAQGKVHGMENLYVADGSVLPRSSRVNPALTIYAWSLRLASKLVQSLGELQCAA
jgi:choline dehydrogenase-like flavoprotein